MFDYPQGRIDRALEVAVKHGDTDDAHKSWVIDQMVRVLTDCPVLLREGIDRDGNTYIFKALGESEKYRELVKGARAGEHGPDTYDWDIGIAP